eukprot:TCONS_00063608-protein
MKSIQLGRGQMQPSVTYITFSSIMEWVRRTHIYMLITAQNKNNAFIWYLMWRILNGFHEKIEYSFMIAGHTKFSCDRCFGSFKKKLRSTRVSSPYEIADVYDQSKCNFAVLVGNHNKDITVQTYDWSHYFEKELRFQTIKDILKYHHFRMS